MYSLDRRISETAFALHGKRPWLDTAAVFCARGLIVLLFFVEIAVFIRLYWILDGRHAWSADAAIVMRDAFLGSRLPVAVLLSAWLVSVLIEVLVGRVRPFRALGKKALDRFWVPTPSLPSSHAAIAFALALPMLALSLPGGIAYAVGAVLVAASRVYVGVHYASDVVVGAAVGLASAFVLGHVFPV